MRSVEPVHQKNPAIQSGPSVLLDAGVGMCSARWTARAFLSALVAVCVWRAWTQSVVHDEAYCWQLYLSQPVGTIFSRFSAANHFLATLLSWTTFHAFSGAPVAMRIPSVLGGVWYFVTVFRLSHLVWKRPLLFCMGIAALTLNPLVLDLFVVARGYGLALAGLTHALFEMVRYLSEGRNRSLLKASVALAFSVGSSLTFLLPAMAIGGTFAILAVRRDDFTRLLTRFFAPLAVLLPALYTVFPLYKAHRDDFYWGVTTWHESVRNLITASFAHYLYIGFPSAPGLFTQIWLNIMILLTCAVLVALLIILCRASWKLLRERSRPVQPHESLFLLSSAGIFLSILGLLVAHAVFDVPYPVDRIGLGFMGLMPMAVLTSASSMPAGSRAAILTLRGSLIMSVVVVFAFAAQFNTRFFYTWRYDADTEHILELIRHDADKKAGLVRLGISWPLEPSINFYRTVKGYSWLAPVDRHGLLGDYDYYVVAPPMTEIIRVDDDAVIRQRNLCVLYRGPVSHTILAAPNR